MLGDLYYVLPSKFGTIEFATCKLGFGISALKVQIFRINLNDQIREPVPIYVAGLSQWSVIRTDGLNTGAFEIDCYGIDFRWCIECFGTEDSYGYRTTGAEVDAVFDVNRDDDEVADDAEY